MQNERTIELEQFMQASKPSTVPYDCRLIRKREKIHVINSIPLLGWEKLDGAKARALPAPKVQIRPVSRPTVEG